jgi:hypothetical protein
VPTLEARVAAQAEQISNLRGDMEDSFDGIKVHEGRINRLERNVAVLVENLKAQRRTEENRQRRLELRIQVLTLVVGVAAVIVTAATLFLAAH